MLGNFLAIISLNIFSGPFSLSPPSKTPIMWMLVHVILFQRSLRPYSFFFHSSFFILFHGSVFHYSCLSSHLFVLLPHLFCYWFLLEYFSVIILFISVCSLKVLSLLNISCIFSVCTSILILRSCIVFSVVFTWILFQVGCLYPLHLAVLTGCYPVPSSVTCLCHLGLSNFLCLWSLFLRLQACNSSWFWCLPPDGLGWSRVLCRLSVMMDWCLPTGGWNWVLSFWWTELCQRVCL